MSDDAWSNALVDMGMDMDLRDHCSLLTVCVQSPAYTRLSGGGNVCISGHQS